MKYLNLKVNLSGKAMVLDDFKDLVSNLGNLCEVNELNLILDKYVHQFKLDRIGQASVIYYPPSLTSSTSSD